MIIALHERTCRAICHQQVVILVSYLILLVNQV